MNNKQTAPAITAKNPTFRLWKKSCDRLFQAFCMLATASCVLILILLLGGVAYQGIAWLDLDFLMNFPSRKPEKAGVQSALWGSIWLITATGLMAVPIGVGAALYLEEYSANSPWRKVIQLNISNLAGVPSIVYGILGLGLFVHTLHLGRSVLSGALTLSLVILPIIIVAAQEALRSVPPSIRTASYALGATRWQTIWRSVLPAATPGIMTGVILAISRAIGEAAPLIVVGAVSYVAFRPWWPSSQYTALPIQIFNWSARPQAEFQNLAAAAIIVLLVLLIGMNAVAVTIRHYYSKRIQW